VAQKSGRQSSNDWGDFSVLTTQYPGTPGQADGNADRGWEVSAAEQSAGLDTANAASSQKMPQSLLKQGKL
jgi:hypothetical protein